MAEKAEVMAMMCRRLARLPARDEWEYQDPQAGFGGGHGTGFEDLDPNHPVRKERERLKL